MKLEPLGDSAVVATLGSGIDAATLSSVLRLSEAITSAKGTGIADVVPAYSTVTVFYDPAQFADDAFDHVCRFVAACASHEKGRLHETPSRNVEIPVCYGGDHGPDLGHVAEQAKMPAADVAALHSGADYLVYAIGFTPGFPYMGGLPKALHTPRRASPRERVQAGSVGIAGQQTGVYPLASPGGWQIIGRTPLVLFRPDGKPACLLKSGDRVRFRAISQEEFESWK